VSDDSIASARRMLASLHGRSIDDMTDAEMIALCRGGVGCVLCFGYGCGIEGQGPVNRHRAHARERT